MGKHIWRNLVNCIVALKTQESLPEKSAKAVARQRWGWGRKPELMGDNLAIEVGPNMGSQIFRAKCPKGYSKLDTVLLSKMSNLGQNRTVQEDVIARIRLLEGLTGVYLFCNGISAANQSPGSSMPPHSSLAWNKQSICFWWLNQLTNKINE